MTALGMVLHAAGCGALSLALAVAPAAAPQRQTARKLFDAGSLSYERAQYSDASRAFEAAYALLPEPEIAFSLAQAHRRQFFVDPQERRRLRAVELYRIYLRESPSGSRREEAVDQLQALESVRPPPTETVEVALPPPPPATELLVYSNVEGATASVDDRGFIETPVIVSVTPGRHEIEMRAPGYASSVLHVRALSHRLIPVEFQLDARPASLQLHSNQAARVLIDGRDVGETPLGGPVTLAAGKHEVRLEAPGRVPARREFVLQRGEMRAVSVDMPRTRRRDAAIGVLGTSAGLWVAGAFTLGFTIRAQRRAREIEDLRGRENISPSELEGYRDDLRDRGRLRAATVSLWSVAAVGTVVGLVLLTAKRR